MKNLMWVIFTCACFPYGCGFTPSVSAPREVKDAEVDKAGAIKVNIAGREIKGAAVAVFAEGCFWTSEHLFESLKGVDSAVCGYSGGHKANPTYEVVSTGTTGHAEAVAVYYNPAVITYEGLLNAFFSSHDPTLVDRQGPDEGNEYRSVIFYHDAAEKTLAEAAKNRYGALQKNGRSIVTQIVPLTTFYKAEDYHQHYCVLHPNEPYIRYVSDVRVSNFKKTFKGNFKQPAL